VVTLLKPTDVARQLNVSRAWVYEAAKDGRIPSVRIGGSDGPLRFVPEDLDRWMQEARDGWTPGRRASSRVRPADQGAARRPTGAQSAQGDSGPQQELVWTEPNEALGRSDRATARRRG